MKNKFASVFEKKSVKEEFKDFIAETSLAIMSKLVKKGLMVTIEAKNSTFKFLEYREDNDSILVSSSGIELPYPVPLSTLKEIGFRKVKVYVPLQDNFLMSACVDTVLTEVTLLEADEKTKIKRLEDLIEDNTICDCMELISYNEVIKKHSPILSAANKLFFTIWGLTSDTLNLQPRYNLDYSPTEQVPHIPIDFIDNNEIKKHMIKAIKKFMKKSGITISDLI